MNRTCSRHGTLFSGTNCGICLREWKGKRFIKCKYCEVWVKEPKEHPSKCPNCGSD